MVRKMSGSLADQFRLEGRGYIRPGYFADVVVFDPGRVVDQATWAEPQRYPVGVHTVLVNGTIAVEAGKPVPGARGGRVLRHAPGAR